MKARSRAKTILGTPFWTKLVRSVLPGLFDVLEEALVVGDVGGEVGIGCSKRPWGRGSLRAESGPMRRIDGRAFGGGMQRGVEAVSGFRIREGGDVERGVYSGRGEMSRILWGWKGDESVAQRHGSNGKTCGACS